MHKDGLVTREPLRAPGVVPEELLPVVYGELRSLAARMMASGPSGRTLQPTALVHEAWLRLGGDEQAPWQTRNHFLAAAGEAMRRILVERARSRQALKRGGDLRRVELEDSHIAAPEIGDQVLVVHEALEKLEAEDPRLAQIVKLRFFAGLGLEEIAACLEINERTVRRQLAQAKVWLLRQIRSTSS